MQLQYFLKHATVALLSRILRTTNRLAIKERYQINGTPCKTQSNSKFLAPLSFFWPTFVPEVEMRNISQRNVPAVQLKYVLCWKFLTRASCIGNTCPRWPYMSLSIVTGTKKQNHKSFTIRLRNC